jgi:ABC-type transport system involved in cytochrome c biogenesis permease subunit
MTFRHAYLIISLMWIKNVECVFWCFKWKQTAFTRQPLTNITNWSLFFIYLICSHSKYATDSKKTQQIRVMKFVYVCAWYLLEYLEIIYPTICPFPSIAVSSLVWTEDFSPDMKWARIHCTAKHTFLLQACGSFFRPLCPKPGERANLLRVLS